MGQNTYIYTLLLVVLTGSYLPPPVRSQTSTEAKALRTALFTTNGYDKTIRPQTNQLIPTDVYVSFYLLAINELNEVKETLQTTGFLVIEWTDQHLVWTPSSYGGIDIAFWPQDDVWKPDVALKNSYKEYKELGASALNVQVSPTGEIVWQPFQVFFSTCAIDVKDFPFDTQTCHLRFVAWSYQKDQVTMSGGDKGIELEQYSPNSAWKVVDTSWSVEWESGEASIKFELKLKRKPMFIVLNTLLPILMLAILNLFAFVLPCESGEKAGYAITVFLAFAVFMTVISATLPENSDTTSVFSVYVVLLTVQSTMITSISLLMVRISQFPEGRKIPRFLIFLTDLTNCTMCKRSTKVSVVTSNKGTDSGEKKMELQSVDMDEDTLDVGMENGSHVTWGDAMRALDIVLLIFFAIVILVASITCIVVPYLKS